MDTVDDILSRDALEGVDLPAGTRQALATSGVPRELRLPEWPGPALFHSELTAGRLWATTAAEGPITRSGDREGYVIGSVRDASDESATPYAFFCLRRGVGDVYLLDTMDPDEDRFVNSSLETFLASMHAFHAAFPHFVRDTEDRDTFIGSFRKLLNKLDIKALEDETHYWPGWLEELE